MVLARERVYDLLGCLELLQSPLPGTPLHNGASLLCMTPQGRQLKPSCAQDVGCLPGLAALHHYLEGLPRGVLPPAALAPGVSGRIWTYRPPRPRDHTHEAMHLVGVAACLQCHTHSPQHSLAAPHVPRAKEDSATLSACHWH